MLQMTKDDSKPTYLRIVVEANEEMLDSGRNNKTNKAANFAAYLIRFCYARLCLPCDSQRVKLDV